MSENKDTGENGLDTEQWGMYGDKPPCEHLLALRAYLESQAMSVSSEHGENPRGWVNVSCERCNRTYEVTLRPPWIFIDSETEEEVEG